MTDYTLSCQPLPLATLWYLFT
uniref:Uncharacterized protein n=1 Tax=Anguilla anguilla TaxID=7936 RepID=A0A0E9WEM4_ANGAN